MLLVSYLRDHRQEALEGLKKRNLKDAEQMVDNAISIDKKRRETQTELDRILAESNTISKQIGQLMKEGKKEQAEQIKVRSSELKDQAKDLSQILQDTGEQLREQLYDIPNIPNENVPEGTTPEDNPVVEEHGETPSLPDGALPQWELVKEYDIIDFDLGNKITGAGFPVYKGKGARLQRALVNLFLDQAIEHGYHEIQPPVLINEDSGYGTGQLPDKEGQMYQLKDENFFLIPTAEVPITNLYRDVILAESDLPVRNVGFSNCFRREAGSWGSHVRGLNRLHQFDKVEIVHIEHPSKSWEALEGMRKYVQSLIEMLELKYRVISLCGGDLGFTSAFTYDMEVYSAAQEKWLEVSSVSNFLSFQANRLKLRYKSKEGKTSLLHTLNGSALALPRILAALLENNQTPDGIRIPKVLIPYTGFEIIEKP